MNCRRLPAVPCCVLVVAVLLVGAGAAQGPASGPDQQPIMEAKLAHAQKLLASLAREDFAGMSASAEALLAVARRQWMEQETPEYRAHLKNFWTVLEGVQTAAGERNLDGATIGYVQMTISCVQCHKYLRDLRR